MRRLRPAWIVIRDLESLYLIFSRFWEKAKMVQEAGGCRL